MARLKPCLAWIDDLFHRHPALDSEKGASAHVRLSPR
jgi:hypothetical protein